MANKRRKIGDSWLVFSSGMGVERKRARIYVDGEKDCRRSRCYFPMTLDGYKQAKSLADARNRDKARYGAAFGAVTDDEKKAVELWRDYRMECMRACCPFLSMPEVVKVALEMVRPKSITPFFPDMVQGWLEMMERKRISEEHLRKRKQKAAKLSDAFAGVRIGSITPGMIQAFLDGLRGRDGKKAMPRTVQDYQVCIGHIFSYAVKQGIIAENPVDRMEKPKVTPGKDPAILTPEQVQTVLMYAAGDTASRPLLPGLLLAVFCGVRPAELARLKHADVNTGKAEIYLSRTLTKTNISRRAKLRDNVLAWWLYAGKEGLLDKPDAFIIPGEREQKRLARYTRRLRMVAAGAGVQIPRDALRHTAASMISALDGMAMAAEELGNDVRTLTRHYRHSVTRQEAVSFFNIMPPE